MLKYVLLAGAMTLSTPALAQDKPVTGDAAPGRQTITQPATPTTPDEVTPDPATDPAAPAPTEQATAQTQTAPVPAEETVATAAPAQDATAPAQDSTVATQAAPADPAVADAAPAEPAATPAASKSEQVASVVNTEFPSYDKDANGDLSESEFGSWMLALKTASDPTTKAESAEVKTWIGQAFASADADKNKSVSKTELTGFLSQGA